jgi:hypothetical protein
VDLAHAILDNFTYAEVKNPTAGQEQTYTYELDDKILETFKYAKEAMSLIDKYIPNELKEKTKFVNGISKGLI